MALDSYTNLKTAIANFLARDDLTSEIDDFIDLTEADLNRRLRIRAMENVSSFTIDSETEALPTGFLQVRSFHLVQNPKIALQFMTPFSQFKAQYEAALKQVEEADEKDKYNGTPLVQRSGININNFDNVK
jgi:hypothetical protein